MLIDATRWQVQFLLSSGDVPVLCNLKLCLEYLLISLNGTVLNENNFVRE